MSEPSPDSQGPGTIAQPASVRLRSSAWVFAAQVGKTALSIPLGILFARMLGATGKGSVSVVQTAAAVAVVLLHLGLPNAVMWLSARGRTSGRAALQMGGVFALSCLALMAVLVLAVGPARTAGLIGLDRVELLVMAVLATGPSMLAYFADAYLVGRGSVRKTQVADVTVLAAQLLVLGGLAWMGRLSAATAVGVWLAGTTVATAWKAVLVLREDRAAAPGGWRALWAEGRTYGIQAWFGSTVNFLSLRQDVLLLAALSGTEAVGIYTVGVAAAELAWYFPNALQAVATAKFSAEQDSLELARRLNRSVWPITVVLCLGILAVVAPLIPRVFGPQFRASILPLVLLMPGIVATSMSTALSAWLSGRGHPGDPALANGVNMLVNFAANLVLIPRYGAAGAAVASSISYAAGSALILWRFARRSGSSPLAALVPRRSDLTEMAAIMSTMTVRRLRSVPRAE